MPHPNRSIRKAQASARRRALRYRRRFRRRAIVGRLTVAEKFASETTPVIRGNNGYAMSTTISEMPQYSLYKQLYRKFRVRSITYILVPQYNSADFPPNTVGPTYPTGTLSRITYSIQDTPTTVAISNENQVLEDNGCKMITSPGKIIYVKHYPKPELATDGTGLTTPVFSFKQKTPMYLNTCNSENAPGSEGDLVPFSGVNVWCAAQTSDVMYAVFTKMTVEFSDPA